MPLSDNLIAYWSLDEASGDAIDAHGTLDLTDNNTVGSATGKVDGCRDFELGNSEYFSHADHADLDTGDIDWTIACWVQLESLPGVANVIASKDDGGAASGNRQFLLFCDSTPRFKFSLFQPTDSEITVTANTFGAPSTATWYYLVAWHDAAANQFGLSVNDTADTAATGGALQGAGAAQFRVGARDNAGSMLYWDGLIDELAFWKRVLSSTERTDLYNSGNGRNYAYVVGDVPVNQVGGGLGGSFPLKGRVYRPRPYAPCLAR